MDNITLLAIDIAKNVFQLHGVGKTGKAQLKKQLSRSKLAEFTANLSVCTIVMEACGGANYWARKFIAQGHTVKLISPQFVKPFVRGNKNDSNDARAIAEAASRPDMKFVSIKTVEQQDIQGLHRIRERQMAQRTAIMNQIRGLLAEYGIVVAQGESVLRRRLPEILEDAENELTSFSRTLFEELYQELKTLSENIAKSDKHIKQLFKDNEACQRIAQIPGVGPITATAIIGDLAQPDLFKNGRHYRFPRVNAWSLPLQLQLELSLSCFSKHQQLSASSFTHG